MQKNPRPQRRTLCIELSRIYGGSAVLAVISIPGREGTVTRAWEGSPSELVTVPTAEDIKSWVAQTVWDWLMLEGLQMVWPPVEGEGERPPTP